MNYVAYPCARQNNDTIKAAMNAGYTLGFILGGKVARKNDGIYTLHRISVVPSDNIISFGSILDIH